MRHITQNSLYRLAGQSGNRDGDTWWPASARVCTSLRQVFHDFRNSVILHPGDGPNDDGDELTQAKLMKVDCPKCRVLIDAALERHPDLDKLIADVQRSTAQENQHADVRPAVLPPEEGPR